MEAARSRARQPRRRASRGGRSPGAEAGLPTIIIFSCFGEAHGYVVRPAMRTIIRWSLVTADHWPRVAGVRRSTTALKLTHFAAGAVKNSAKQGAAAAMSSASSGCRFTPRKPDELRVTAVDATQAWRRPGEAGITSRFSERECSANRRGSRLNARSVAARRRARAVFLGGAFRASIAEAGDGRRSTAVRRASL